jgi:uncharacterized protein YunC (DUF1805 family)
MLEHWVFFEVVIFNAPLHLYSEERGFVGCGVKLSLDA